MYTKGAFLAPHQPQFVCTEVLPSPWLDFMITLLLSHPSSSPQQPTVWDEAFRSVPPYALSLVQEY